MVVLPVVREKLVATAYDPIVGIADRLFLEKYRHVVAHHARGTVLEIGAGTGIMVPKYDTSQVLAVEPNPEMRRRGRSRTAEMDSVHWLSGIGERLPIGSNSVDIVVCSMVLCTVSNPKEVITEAARVLRDTGELCVLEHIAATGVQGSLQRAITPVWQPLADGCDPHRHTDRLLATSGEFEPIDARIVPVGVPPIRPYLVGRYRPCTDESERSSTA